MRVSQSLLVLSVLLSCSTAGPGYQRVNIVPLRKLSLTDFTNFGFHLLFNALHLEPEAYLNTAELIEYNDFPVEQHTVTTEDGYILALYRISGKNRYDTTSSEPRSPVILFPEVAFPSELYLHNTRNDSLGFVLADAGFDVWLANWRGTEYSRQHATLDPEGDEYWKYSLDDLGKYDVVDTIKHVHRETSQKVHIIAKGYGALGVLLGLTAKPEVNSMINLNIGLSPVLTWEVQYSNVIRHGLDYQELLDYAELTSMVRAGISDPSAARFIAGLATIRVPGLAKYLLGGTGNLASVNFNMTRLPIYSAHIPTEIGFFLAKQLIQIPLNNEVRQLDWGKEENLRRHGTAEPQLYNFKTIPNKYLLLQTFSEGRRGGNYLNALKKVMPADMDVYSIPDDSWNQMSYFFSTNGRTALFDYLIDYMRKLEKGELVRSDL